MATSLAIAFLSLLAQAPSAGGIVAVGGGAMPDRIYARVLSLTGRKDPQVLILPLATATPADSGTRSEARFRELGARRVDWRSFKREEASKGDLLEAIRAAEVVWFPGGDQRRILEAVRGTAAESAIRDVVARGGVVGGTSAGCEVLGELSLTEAARLDLAVRGATQTEAGLGLVPGVVFDQHFLRRARFLRLLAATLDARRSAGIGIDESTAVVIPHGSRTLEVIGDRQVTIFRANEETRIAAGKPGDLHRASDLRLHVLAEGDRYDLDKDRVLFGEAATKAPPAEK